MLRGMGFDKSTSIYLASGHIYNSEQNMAPLLDMFPRLQTKNTLATAEELEPYKVWFFGDLFYSFMLMNGILYFKPNSSCGS